ncbi:MAG: cryptochrome DASH, partial [Cytophagia bacterium]|nr:cryptochrome DASH [Cytophagia bacterium]
LIFELLWRDYFRFAAKKYGVKIFQRKGLRNKPVSATNNVELFEKWRAGETGIDFIDANMKELLHTGFISNRGRQNVASYLAKDYKVNWTWGAAWFESQLIDYDVASNWLNWAYIAGVGNDPREDRYFNTESQVRKYDPKGEYTRYWLSDNMNAVKNAYASKVIS